MPRTLAAFCESPYAQLGRHALEASILADSNGMKIPVRMPFHIAHLVPGS
jgi:hypothetical protein